MWKKDDTVPLIQRNVLFGFPIFRLCEYVLTIMSEMRHAH